MQEIKNILQQTIKNLYNLDFDPELTSSPDNIDADYSTNAPLKLAKELHKSPMQIAKELERKIAEVIERYRRVTALEGVPKMFAEQNFGEGEELVGPVERLPQQDSLKASISAPGFLNFALSDDYLTNSIDNFNHNFTSDKFKDQTVICEFSDPNPFKVLHVGHLYTSIVGDSIARLFEYAGAKVIRANFGGDVGLHVAKTMYALRQKSPDELTIEDIAKCYIEGTAAYDTDEKAKAEITKLNKEIYQINAEGAEHGRVTALGGPPFELDENGGKVPEGPAHNTAGDGRTRPESELAALYWRGRELSYDYFNDFYNSIGVKFDKYYPESTVANLGLNKVKEELEKGVYEMSNGAVIFDGEKYGLHTRVFINKEGVPTYETKDVGLIFQKYADYHFDKSIVITGNEQLEYMKVVLKSIEQYAPELVEKTTHLTHGLVKLPGNVKMSSRKGNFLKAVDVLNMIKDELKSAYDSSDEIVSLAATKYAFLKYKMGGNIIFDPKESVKMTGNSGPYLLYSAVRAKKILGKALAPNAETVDSYRRVADLEGDPKMFAKQNFGEGEDPAGPVERISVRPRSERNLIKKLLEYTAVLDEAVTELAPHKVANFLYELAQCFSRFYENCPVNGSDQKQERLKLVKTYLDVMTHGLNILGINTPEEM